MKTMTIADILTDAEIKRAIKLKDHAKVRDELIVPNMARINAALGQENDPDYLAYAVQYVLTASGHWRDT